MPRRVLLAAIALVAAGLLWTAASARQSDPRLDGSFRKPATNGWTLVHLQGPPATIGYQHGALLAAGITDVLAVVKAELKHDTGREWAFFRDAGRTLMWPKIDAEYRDEMQGIADGAKSRGAAVDVWDIVALNGMLEWSYYTAALDKAQGKKDSKGPAEHCSAFVATGSYTSDRRPVIAHNNWSSYMDGARWTIVFDIQPARGHRILMDGLPGLIHSGDDFGINAAGLGITETTIGGFAGYDTAGVPEFVRARKAMQYGASIDDFARIMKDGNNGGYANDWLIVDTRRNEIAHLELGLKHVTLERTRDGYFVGSNYPKNPDLVREETNADPADLSLSANARRVRWEQLMAENKGKIDLAAAQRFESDHYDSYAKKIDPNERTLCGHIDRSPRGSKGWMEPFGIAGTVQNKAATASMIEAMTLSAAAGHACGIDFDAAAHLAAHPEFAWQRGLLRNLPSGGWTTISAAK